MILRPRPRRSIRRCCSEILQDPTTAGPIPKFGEHNAEIFGGLLNLDDDAMAKLREDEVIGD